MPTRERVATLAFFFCSISSIASFVINEPHHVLLSAKRRLPHVHQLSSAVADEIDLNYVIVSALKKPSKTLAVGIDYKPLNSDSSSSDLSILSMQLRKSKASALWTSDGNAAKEFVKEQESAQGSFPGPCPIIYYDNQNDNAADVLSQAVDAGVTAAVVSPSQVSSSEILNDYQVQIVWNIQSADELEESVVKDDDSAVFLINADDEEADSILDAIPTGSVVIASMDAMQEENLELSRGKDLKAKGVTSILLREACVGDSEDVEYSTFAINGLTKKQSSTFNMSGLTGSTNGHFGGVAGSGVTTWLRKK